MGEVLEAVQEPIGRRVAVKVLHRKYAQEPQVTARFFNEARAVNLIDHPGVVQVSDYGQMPDGTAYLVMELLKGDTLSQRIKRGPLSLPEIMRLARQVSAALAAAHEKNVFHRDLKPDNIMLVPEQDAETPGRERVKILDFGIAKVMAGEEGSPKTATDIVMGTPRYMAPEQCRGGGTVDGKSDVYSLGVLLYELLAGRPPFTGPPGEVLAMHIYEPPPPLAERAPNVPDELVQLVHRLLAKKREERPTMKEVQASLEQLSVRHPTSVLQALKWSPPPVPATPSGQAATAGMSMSGSGGTPQMSSRMSGQAQPLPRPPSSKWLVPALALVSAFALTLGIYWGLQPAAEPQKPKPKLEAAASPPDAGQSAAAPVVVSPLRVRLTLTSTPAGAQVLRVGETKPLGTTPWSAEFDASPEPLDLRLRLPGYAEKLVRLERTAPTTRNETLEKRPRLGLTRPGIKLAPPPPKKPPEHPHIVD